MIKSRTGDKMTTKPKPLPPLCPYCGKFMKFNAPDDVWNTWQMYCIEIGHSVRIYGKTRAAAIAAARRVKG